MTTPTMSEARRLVARLENAAFQEGQFECKYITGRRLKEVEAEVLSAREELLTFIYLVAKGAGAAAVNAPQD